MNKLLYSLVALILGTGFSVAQGHLNCGTQEKINAIWAENPQLERDWKKSFAANLEKDGDDTTIFIIPIVFHILHENGTENISDAQVQNQVDILNRDYRLLNADTSQVINDFKTIYGDAKIEFRLAKIDPYGNCTNGIEHIYTHLTNNADDYSKIHQWFRPNYLNVWVVKTIGDAGVAGYAYYPNATNDQAFPIDGIIIKHEYIGGTNVPLQWTGEDSRSRALTHEIGHWLALPHVWGSNNDAAQVCGDDGFDDTPITKGWTSCPGSNYDVCNAGINENFQNYMDYSYCSVMFTKEQIEHMRAVVQLSDGHRNELITAETHAATGIDQINPSPCIPIADFFTANTSPCVGTNVNFRDASYNAPVTNYMWIFPDGTPSTSTSQNPTVSFNTTGYKTITLIVSNGSGSDTMIRTQYVRVNGGGADFTGPKMLNLNDASSHPEWFQIINPENNWATFGYSPVHGRNGGGCFRLNNYKAIGNVPIYSPEYYYYLQLGESKDILITPSFDLRFTSGATFSFDYSYASNANTVADITEEIVVSYSKDCGATWTNMGGSAVVTGAALLSGGFASNTDFAPTSDNQWATKTINLSAGALAAKTMFKFTFIASDKSSNLYIDNINIQGSGFAGLNDFGVNNELVISPNPVVSGNNLKIEYTAANEPVTFTLRNLQGAEVMTTVRNETNQFVSFDLEIGTELPASYYFLEVKSASATTVKKIVVVKQ